MRALAVTHSLLGRCIFRHTRADFESFSRLAMTAMIRDGMMVDSLGRVEAGRS